MFQKFFTIGSFFKPKKIIEKNLEIAFPENKYRRKKLLKKKYGEYYGKFLLNTSF